MAQKLLHLKNGLNNLKRNNMAQQTYKKGKPMTYWVSENDDNKEGEGTVLYFVGNIIALIITFILFRILIEL